MAGSNSNSEILRSCCIRFLDGVDLTVGPFLLVLAIFCYPQVMGDCQSSVKDVFRFLTFLYTMSFILKGLCGESMSISSGLFAMLGSIMAARLVYMMLTQSDPQVALLDEVGLGLGL